MYAIQTPAVLWCFVQGPSGQIRVLLSTLVMGRMIRVAGAMTAFASTKIVGIICIMALVVCVWRCVVAD